MTSLRGVMDDLAPPATRHDVEIRCLTACFAKHNSHKGFRLPRRNTLSVARGGTRRSQFGNGAKRRGWRKHRAESARDSARLVSPLTCDYEGRRADSRKLARVFARPKIGHDLGLSVQAGTFGSFLLRK